MLNWIEKKCSRFAIPHLTWILMGGQGLFFLACTADPTLLHQLDLRPDKVFAGEFWRVLVFMFIPQTLRPIWFAVSLWFLYWVGTTLENHWGDAKYNAFILIGYLATVASSFCFPHVPGTNFYLITSIFLAFAYLYPDFQILLFFIIPVKVKYLAIFQWCILSLQLVGSSWPTKILILAAVLNFFIFFGKDMVQRAITSQKNVKRKAENIRQKNEPFHECSVCKRTDKTNPQLHFRYAPANDGTACFC